MADWKEEYIKEFQKEAGEAVKKKVVGSSQQESLKELAKKLAQADYDIERLICPELLPFSSVDGFKKEEATIEELRIRGRSLDKKKECEGKFKVVPFCGDKGIAKKFSFEIRLESLKGPATILCKGGNFYLMHGFIQRRFGDPYKVWNVFHALDEGLIDTLLRNMRKNLPLHEGLPEAYREMQEKRQWL